MAGRCEVPRRDGAAEDVEADGHSSGANARRAPHHAASLRIGSEYDAFAI